MLRNWTLRVCPGYYECCWEIIVWFSSFLPVVYYFTDYMFISYPALASYERNEQSFLKYPLDKVLIINTKFQ